MSKAELTNQRSPPSNSSPNSTQRVARRRERKRRGVLFMAGIEVLDRDLRALERCGYLASDDPAMVGKDDFGTALGFLLDALAERCGVFGAGSDPAKGSV